MQLPSPRWILLTIGSKLKIILEFRNERDGRVIGDAVEILYVLDPEWRLGSRSLADRQGGRITLG